MVLYYVQKLCVEMRVLTTFDLYLDLPCSCILHLQSTVLTAVNDEQLLAHGAVRAASGAKSAVQ